MTTQIFLTKKLTTKRQPQFTSNWFYLVNRDNQPIEGEIDFTESLDQIRVKTDAKEFKLYLHVDSGPLGKIMLRTSLVKNKTSHHHELLPLLIKGRIEQIEKLVPAITKESQFLELKQARTSLRKLHNIAVFSENFLLTWAKQQPQVNLKFFGQAFRILESKKLEQIHTKLFDGGVVPIYFFKTNPDSAKKFVWGEIDQIIERLQQNKQKIKGHPLIWLHEASLPDWMKSLTFPELKTFIIKRTEKILQRYNQAISIWDITNEFPTQDANFFQLTNAQLLELTKIASELVARLAPKAERVINISDIFAGHSFIHSQPSIPPEFYLKMLVEQGIEFESIGLQFYMGMRKEFVCRDLVDILERLRVFAKFKKSLHLSELGWPSQNEVDPNSFFGADHPMVAGWWHQPWNETVQAEFFQGLKTIFATLPQARSMTWWDLTDHGSHMDIGSRFIPFGSISRRDFSLKPLAEIIAKEKLQTGGRRQIFP